MQNGQVFIFINMIFVIIFILFDSYIFFSIKKRGFIVDSDIILDFF
jgi:hypothetical protein